MITICRINGKRIKNFREEIQQDSIKQVIKTNKKTERNLLSDSSIQVGNAYQTMYISTWNKQMELQTKQTPYTNCR